MQELLNALFIIFIYSANQAKPIHYSVRRYTNTSIEFHSWYVLSIDEWYLTITDSSRKTKVRTRLAIDGKMSPEFMKVLKDLLNKDFNSWIKIEDEPRGDEGNIWNTEADDANDTGVSEWEDTNDTDNKTSESASTEKAAGDVNDNSEATTWADEEKKTSQRKIPEWSKVQKKK